MILLPAAFAADVSTYALHATVDLPASGPARVALPPDLVGADPFSLTTGVSILDRDGNAIPYAVLLSSSSPSLETEDLYVRPTSTESWESGAAAAPVDALRLGVPELGRRGPFRARVSWLEDGEWNAAEEQLIYAEDTEEGRTVAVPHVRGPFRVELRSDAGARPALLDVTAIHLAPEHVPPAVEEVQVPTPVLTESGAARYVLKLLGPRRVTALRFTLPASVDVLDRSVTVTAPSGETRYGSIRRLRVGAADVAELEVAMDGLVADSLTVEIPLNREAPPQLDALDVVSEGAWLLVRDAGPGPHTIYAGATEMSAAYDLSSAQSELLRTYPPVVEPRDVAPNPAFVPLPTREGLDLPGPDLRLDRFAYERDLVGTGWVRVTLGPDVFGKSRTDGNDLRVVDAEGRQLPFLLRPSGNEVDLPLGEVEREERGGLSRLRIPVPGNAPLATLVLETSQDVLQRQITVRRDAGRVYTTLRSVSWGSEVGKTLAISLGERVGPALIVEIDNGDDAPLPITAVRATVAEWELRTRLPEGGARLVYGAVGERAPDHDLALVATEVDRIPLAEASLGEERALQAPTPSVVDRLAAVAGVGLLALGLLAVGLRAVLGKVVEPEEAQTGA